MSKWEYGLYFVATVDAAGVLLREVVGPAVLEVVDHKEEVEVVEKMKFSFGCQSILVCNVPDLFVFLTKLSDAYLSSLMELKSVKNF